MSGEGARVGLPQWDGGGDVAALRRDIERWIGSEPLRDLVGAFGGNLPAVPGRAVPYLADFSATHWDFRFGRERAQARRRDFDAGVTASILRGAAALGLRDHVVPHFGHYTHVLVLGGLASACLQRTAFAARLLRQGITTEAVSAVGGFRELAASERDTVPGGVFEVDAMETGVRRAFGLPEEATVETDGDPHADPRRAWRVSTRHNASGPVRVVAAPSSRPAWRRANTGDTCQFWAERVARLDARDRVLVVTAAIYTPFQHCDAIGGIGLPYGCAVDTVGMPADEEWGADKYLQEIRSAVLSMGRLYARTA